MDRSWLIPCIIVVIVLMFVCCLAVLCIIGSAAGAMAWVWASQPIDGDWLLPAATPVPIERPLGPIPTDTLETLEQTVVPVNDLRDLAERLQGVKGIPETLPPPAAPLQTGDRHTFRVTNVDTNENFQVEATLRYVTDHAYFWLQDGVEYDAGDLKKLADTFESEIYPTNREFFGSEWTPGIDGDVHLYVLYARGIGSTIAGYFSSADEVPPQAHEYSNGHELFLLSADNVAFDEESTYAVLAHEFQHMIHWYRDRNETSWLNEGFSELAAFLNGYDVGGHDWLFTQDPDIQLTDWPNDQSATPPHYGAAFLFTAYFLDRFGEEATQSLVADPANGMASVENALAQIAALDPLTGQPIRANDLFADWVVALYLQDESVADGRYAFHNYPGAPQPGDTESLYTCPLSPTTRDVSQYGVDYIRITCAGDYTLHFEGSTRVDVLPADAHSGSYAFWSNKGDESDMTLTRQLDFTGQSGALTLSYWTWYDLEEDYDYLYLEASTDGESWQILDTPSCTTEDPSGNSYGCGYNALSGGGGTARWIQETVDLSQFAGEKVWLRFEYVTDAAVNGEGLLLDDVSIPEVGYSSDFEADDGGWEAEGFVRIQNVLPQTFRLALITKGAVTTVQYIPIAPDITADIPLHIGGDVREVILVVSGTTRFTRQMAGYQIEIRP